MTTKERFLSNRKRYQPITFPKEFSDEEMARDWTLSDDDKEEVVSIARTPVSLLPFNSVPFASMVDS